MRLTSAATSTLRGSQANSAPQRADSSSRAVDRIRCHQRAPVRFTSMVNISPIGPCPRITTKSSGCGSHCTTAFRQVFSGSTRVARSNEMPSGIRLHAGLHNPVHHPDILGESAPGRLKSGRDPDFLVYRTLGIYLTLAIEAFAAGYVMERHHPVARCEPGDAAAHRGHYARCLVAVNARRSQQVVFDLLEVGMADAACLDTDENLARTDLRRRDLFHRNYAVRRGTRRRAWSPVSCLRQNRQSAIKSPSTHAARVHRLRNRSSSGRRTNGFRNVPFKILIVAKCPSSRSAILKSFAISSPARSLTTRTQ